MSRIAVISAVAALVVGIGTAGLSAADRKSVPAPEGHPLDEIISGYEFRNKETQALQNDDFENPGFLWVDIGQELWDTAEGTTNKACADCHGAAAGSMAMAGAEFPKWSDSLNRPVNLEQQINLCRTQYQQADAWKYESEPLLGMTAFVRNQSRGEPVRLKLDGPLAPWFERGKELYYTRVGQLDLACANCHEDYAGTNIRSDMLSQGQSNGFPLYRLKWQKLGSLHRRMKGCMNSVRAEPYKVGGEEFIAMELYLGWRGQGLPVETPAVRQ